MFRSILKAVFYIAIAGAAVLMISLYTGGNRIRVSRFQIPLDRLPEEHEGLRIVHISDLHGKEFGWHNEDLARAIEALDPDLIFTSGDMMNSQNDDGSAFINLLYELKGLYPIYCSLGNHEQIVRGTQGTERYHDFTRRLREAGGILLDNERVEIKKGGTTFGLYGFTAALHHYSSHDMLDSWDGAELEAQFIVESIGRPRDDEVTILLAHNPKYFREYVTWGADLVCAGHIHGGVVRLPLLGGILSPDLTFFPRFSGGLYRSGKTTMHVSRGLGNSVIPVRIFNPPDLSLLLLRPR